AVTEPPALAPQPRWSAPAVARSAQEFGHPVRLDLRLEDGKQGLAGSVAADTTRAYDRLRCSAWAWANCSSCSRSCCWSSAPVAGCSPLPGGEPTLDSALRARQLMVPVAGVSPDQVPDNFRAPRSGARIHGAVDIPAPRGTPVLSADDGRVLRLQRNRKGGLTIYATDESEHFIYYYAHLAAYCHGLAKDTRLVRGQVIGSVGTTGDAHRREPHLHFQVMVRPSDGRWWSGDA